MSFLRRLSEAVLPSTPRASGSTPAHVPILARETFTHPLDHYDDYEDGGSRASWELSETSSVKSGSTASASDSESEGRASFDSSSDGQSDDEEDRKDKYDVMTAYLWQTADRLGWFRDPDYDGLISIR